ncbi:DUF2079 domain-containing protein [Patescibacteria group bacterium]
MWKGKKVSLIFPTYNEKDSIKEAIIDFEKSGYIDEIIVVNNNAAKGTSEEVSKANSKITREVIEKRQGYGFAIRRGFKEAKGDLIIVAEPDGTFSGGDVIKLLSYSEEFDVVYGSRTSRQLIWGGANMGWFLRWGNLFVAKLMEVLFNTTNLTDVGCTTRLVKKEVIDKIDSEFTVGREHFGPEMMILTFLHKFRCIQIPVNYLERVGVSSVTGDYWKALKLGIIMILLIVKYRLSYFGRFHLPRIKAGFSYIQGGIRNLLDKIPGFKILKIPAIYYLAVAYLLLFFGLTYLRWQAHTPSMDYHAYVQMLHNTVKGKLLMYNQSRGTQIHFFKLHFAPFLILISYIYRFVQHPLTLYFIFNIFIAASIIPIYLYALDILKRKSLAYLVSFIYMIYHPFVWSHQQGFCEEAFATPLLAFAFYFLHKNNSKLFILFSLLTLGLRVNMVLPVFMLGFYAFFFGKKKPEGLFLSSVSIFWVIYVLKFINPKFIDPGSTPYIFGFFGDYGGGVREILTTMVRNPKLVIDNVLGETKLRYLKNLFSSLFFLPLFAPKIMLIAAPLIGLSLVASSTRLASTVAYYHSSITPFLFFALVSALKAFRGRRIVKFGLIGMLLYSIFINWSYGYGANLPFSKYFEISRYEVTKRDRQHDIVLRNIPHIYSIGAQDIYMEHLAQREWYFSSVHYGGYLPDLVVFDAWRGGVYTQIVGDDDWSEILEIFSMFVYAKNTLINTFDMSEGLDFSAFSENKEYLAILKSTESENYFSTGVGRDRTVEITSDVVFAQQMDFTSEKVGAIEIPIKKIKYPISSFKERLATIFKPPRGKLKIEILKHVNDAPFGKVVYDTSIDKEDLTYKEDSLFLDLSAVEWDIEAKYWIVFSIDKNDGRDYDRYNIFRIYTAGKTKEEKESEEYRYKLSQDQGRHWKPLLGNTELLYKIHYISKGVPKYEDNRLASGDYIFSGRPKKIRDWTTEVFGNNNKYSKLIFIGTERDTK